MLNIGFKYIGNAARTLEAEGYNVLFGYEEAIGFMLGEEVRDKDGVSATVCAIRIVYLFDTPEPGFRCVSRSSYAHYIVGERQRPITWTRYMLG